MKKTKPKYNPRNTGKLGKKRSKAFCKAQSKRLRGIAKNPATRARMRKAAKKRWSKPEYRKLHGDIMRKRWKQVHLAEKIIKKNQKIKTKE